MQIAETERLVLRTWTPDDAEAAFRIWGNQEVMRLTGSEPHDDLARTRRSLAAAERVQAETGMQLWAVVERQTGRVIGDCGFHAFEQGQLELAYHLVPDAWGRGYATEAARAALAYARDHLGAERVLAFHFPDNVTSRRVLEKLGFSRAGTQDGEWRWEKQL